ncbi:Serine protease inhibitor 3/4 [Intoshia linei]|uniref:Serine protease inhibitor 3/4 n=1 Tax=Intoshia linei TaxID=1819745 RepID=A0A177BCM0_9BILA|nr:Serine protease inhibitor 3/4 [Intoshia linei]
MFKILSILVATLVCINSILFKTGSTKKDVHSVIMQTLVENSHDDNLCFSQLSMDMVLSMIYYGVPSMARSEFLQFNNIGKSFEWLSNLKNEIMLSNDIKFEMINKFYISFGYYIKPCYLKSLFDIGIDYDNVETMDFTKKEEVDKINEVVSKITHNEINDLVPEGAILPGVRSVIINAISMKAAFKQPFDKNLTSKRKFTSMGLDEVTQVDTMYINATFKHFQNEKFNIVEIPYSLNGLSLLIVQPLECLRDNDWIGVFETGAKVGPVSLFLPKFNVTSKMNLKNLLINVGIKKVFGINANLGLLSNEHVFVCQGFHMATLEVDETAPSSINEFNVDIESIHGTQSTPTEIRIDSTFYAYVVYESNNDKRVVFNSLIQKL